jgi:hypothetical protein
MGCYLNYFSVFLTNSDSITRYDLSLQAVRNVENEVGSSTRTGFNISNARVLFSPLAERRSLN